MNNEYVGMLKGFGAFVFSNWEIFLGLAAIILIGKFVKMGLGVARTLIILYVLFVVYKYQDYDKIKTQLSGDMAIATDKMKPMISTIDSNLTSKISGEDRGVIDKFMTETKGIVGGAFSTTDTLIQQEKGKINDGK